MTNLAKPFLSTVSSLFIITVYALLGMHVVLSHINVHLNNILLCFACLWALWKAHCCMGFWVVPLCTHTFQVSWSSHMKAIWSHRAFLNGGREVTFNRQQMHVSPFLCSVLGLSCGVALALLTASRNTFGLDQCGGASCPLVWPPSWAQHLGTRAQEM